MRGFATARLRVSSAAAAGLVALAVGGGVAAFAVAGAPSEPADTRTVTAPSPSSGLGTPEQARAPRGSLRGAFSVLGKGRSKRDNLPTTANVDALVDHAGANPSLSHRARSLGSDDAVYVMPSADGVCLVTEHGGTCNRADQALDGKVLGAELCSPTLSPGTIRVYGLVPDGVGSVTVGFDDGSSSSVSIVGNVFALETTRVPRSVAWGDGAGSEPISLPVPPDAASVGCDAGSP
jgi:hypothetical protein